MKQINSVLLPGEFFKNNFLEKTEKLMTIKVDTVYLFDHEVNPANKNLDVYELIEEYTNSTKLLMINLV